MTDAHHDPPDPCVAVRHADVNKREAVGIDTAEAVQCPGAIAACVCKEGDDVRSDPDNYRVAKDLRNRLHKVHRHQ